MNDIVFAYRPSGSGSVNDVRYAKCLKVSAPAEDGVVLYIDRPLLPAAIKEFTARAGDGFLCDAICEAERRLKESGAGGAVVSALGDLIVAFIAEYSKIKLHPVAAALKADIEKNFSDSTYSADVGIRKLPLNYDYVRKLFKREIGVTPHEYLNELRMERAQKLISGGVSNSYSNYTVAQVAEACGFAEPLYFSRVFKQRFGQSPMQYAKNN